jgi:two-component system sensor histidine kinase/response regulator
VEAFYRLAEVSKRKLTFVLLVAGMGAWLPGQVVIADEIRIGLRANRGAEIGLERWQPTADYLSQAIPGHHFVMVPFEINSQLNQAVSRGEFEFVLTNPAAHVEQRLRYGVSPIATLVNKRKGEAYTRFGSVVFTRAERNDITSFQDLKGKKFMAADEIGFGGWRVAWREMAAKGIDPFRDFRVMSFAGGIQQAVVSAVREGIVDAGSVRTDMLERMAQNGEINLDEFKVIEPRKTANFGFLHSTRLYPEWPFAKLEQTSDELASQVAAALYKLTPDSEAAKAGKYMGWIVPLDYAPVDELLKELRVGPYQNSGMLSPVVLLKTYWQPTLLVLLFLCGVLVASIMVMRSNVRLRETKRDLEDYREQLEAKVNERTAELTASNKELESYSYSIAHDLRAPLRSIVGFSQILADGAVEKLNPEELDAFNRIASSGKRMADLIDDILELSRITRRTIKKESVDLSAIAQNVSLALSVIDPNRKINWKLQNDMAVTGDRHLIEVLLQNLMDNARKFTREEAKPTIEVGEQQIDGVTTYFVKDNGVGFDVAYVDNIFVPFHRLHRQEFEGTGVGLATVRRVVERHGGKVWAESEEGQGAIFYFTLGA